MTPVLNLSSLHKTPVFTLQYKAPGVKSVYGASYQGKTQSWLFPAFHPVYEFVISDLKKVVPGLQLSKEVINHVNLLKQNPSLPSEFSYLTKPYQHQIDGLEHLYRNIRAGLFYSPGLGKCKITVDLQRLTGDTMLIVCPKIMLDTWAEEFKKHGGITDVHVIDGQSKKKKLKQIAEAVATPPKAVILTYGVATLYPEDIIKIPYDCIVADESHQLKSPFAKRTKAVTALAGRAYRRVLLSGTPSLGSPFDMYGQLRFLGTYFCPENWWTFRKTFGVFPSWEAEEKVPKMVLGFKNLDLMNARVNLICLRKTKEECLDLPDQVTVDLKFPVYPQQKKLYNSLITDRTDQTGATIRDSMESGTLGIASGPTLPPHVIAEEQITLLGKLDQISSGFLYKTTKNPQLCNGCEHVFNCLDNNVLPYTTSCKVVQKPPSPYVHPLNKNARAEECKSLLETILKDDDNKVIIWATYNPELDQIEALAKEAGVKYVRVQGGMSRSAVETRMSQFNEDPDYRIYIGQVSTGIGITLNAANYVIYYNLPWSLEHYQQSLDRNYRIGQTRKVTVYRLLARYTLDESKAAALDQKIDFSKLVTHSGICATCPDFSSRCAKYNIKLYDSECIYDRQMLRKTAQVRRIP